MNYKEEITKAMTKLAQQPDTIFIGQSIAYPGHVLFHTLEGVPMEKRLEFPVAEDFQLGFSIGLALMGYLPISVYPRMDFLVLALNQIVNHLDKIPEMSAGQYTPKVIIRTLVGSKTPMNPGPQHCQDYTEALRKMISIPVYRIKAPEAVSFIYNKALEQKQSCIIVEIADLYD